MSFVCYRKKPLRYNLFLASILTAGTLVSCRTTSSPYEKGDRIDPKTWLSDSSGKKVFLQDLAKDDSKLLCLFFFGAAHGKEKEKKGGLWCGDSFYELPVFSEVLRHFQNASVRFIPVACPPVYGDGGFGDARSRFLDSAEDSSEFREAADLFVQNTEDLRRAGKLPFSEIFYDPRFRLLLNRKKPLPSGGAVEAWEGRFKVPEDLQNYGTPCVWILSRDARVIGPPFWGNNYPDHIRYRAEDVIRAIDEALKKSP